MDLRPPYFLATTLALALGVIMGWQDAQEALRGQEGNRAGGDSLPATTGAQSDDTGYAGNRGDSGDSGESGDPGDSPGEPPSGKSPSGKSPSGKSPSGPELSVSTDGGFLPDDTTATSGVVPPTPDEDRRLEAIEHLLKAQEFDRAAQQSADLAVQSRTSARDLALRLEARARAFAVLVPEGKAAPPPRIEVLYANRSRVYAMQAIEEPDGYRLTLENGDVIWADREDVLELERLNSREYLQTARSELARRGENWVDPVRIYREGVLRFYELGFPQEGYRVLLNLLWQPGSDRVARDALREAERRAGSAGAGLQDLVKNWEIAAGLRPPAGHEGEIDEDGPISGLDRAGGNRGALSGRSIRPADPSTDQPTFDEAQRLFSQANDLYVNAFRQEGREDELRRAIAILERTESILVRLPAEDRVTALRRRLMSLKRNVNRSLPLGD